MSKQVQVQREYSPAKVSTIERIVRLTNDYPVIVITQLSKVRSAQLMAVRKVLRGNAEIVVVKNKLAKIALSKCSKAS